MLSTLIICKNEEKDIKGCLENIKKISDEIIIVDSYSNDKTLEIAKKYTKKIYLRKFDNFANQRNYAIKKSIGDWVFVIDPDESLSKKSIKKILNLIRNTNYSGYIFPRRNYISKNKWLKHGLFYPDYQVRLFRNITLYAGYVHERPLLNFNKLKRVDDIYIIHKYTKSIYKSFFAFSKLISENRIYLEAKQKTKQNKNIIYHLYNGPSNALQLFITGFLLNRGFLDGWAGFRAAIIFSMYRLSVEYLVVLIKFRKYFNKYV